MVMINLSVVVVVSDWQVLLAVVVVEQSLIDDLLLLLVDVVQPEVVAFTTSGARLIKRNEIFSLLTQLLAFLVLALALLLRLFLLRRLLTVLLLAALGLFLLAINYQLVCVADLSSFFLGLSGGQDHHINLIGRLVMILLVVGVNCCLDVIVVVVIWIIVVIIERLRIVRNIIVIMQQRAVSARLQRLYGPLANLIVQVWLMKCVMLKLILIGDRLRVPLKQLMLAWLVAAAAANAIWIKIWIVVAKVKLLLLVLAAGDVRGR